MRRFMTTVLAVQMALFLTSGADREPPPPVEVALVRGPLC